MVIFKTVNKDSNLDRTFKFTDLKHDYTPHKLLTTFKVYELVNDEWVFYMNYGIENHHYKKLNTCAFNWFKSGSGLVYDGISIVED